MIEVVAVAGVALVQDGGRPGRMHEGIPPGGALVPELLARCNAAVGNGAGEAGVEIFGSITLAAHGDSVRVGLDDGTTHVLSRGAVYQIEPGPHRVRYAAVRGGVDVPEVLGGRGTLLVAGIGGFAGRPLRRGDRLAVGGAAERGFTAAPLLGPGDPIPVVLGPDASRFAREAVDTLLRYEYRVSARSDRVGMRLVGPTLERIDGDDGISAPMVRGAIQVPSSGEPIVLGPDHPTMGGYPVIATVRASGLGSLMLRAPGSAVRFHAPTRLMTTDGEGGI